MNYAIWALLAMVGYGVTAVFLKAGLRNIPPEAAIVITNGLLVIAGVVWAVTRRVSIAGHINMNLPTLYLLLAGLTLSFSIISYYIALSRGPASVVVPIFALNLTVVAVLGILVLGEPMKLTRVGGVLLAAGAIVLLTR